MTQADTTANSPAPKTGLSKLDEMFYNIKQRKTQIDQENANINQLRAQADEKERGLQSIRDTQKAAIEELSAAMHTTFAG
jgi:hypothetical protein